MRKDTFFTGQPIFNQLLKLIPKNMINSTARDHHADRYCKKFMSYDHLVSMLYATFHKCKSLREVTTGMMACTTKINHLGIKNYPHKSTLADANIRRTEVFFADLYFRLYKLYFPVLPDSRKKKSIEDRLFVVDSTTIELFTEIFKGVGLKPVNGKRKGGIKAHVLMKYEENIPEFVYLGHAKENDLVFMPMINLPTGSIVTFDRAYFSWKYLREWDQNKVTWVTRLRKSTAYTVISSLAVSEKERTYGILANEIVQMGDHRLKNRIKGRKITYYDEASKKTLVFISNNLKMSSVTIALIYKKRWQIECLFKRFKQNYPLKYFLGDSQNAIKIQIWCALITDLLIKIVKNQIKRKWSFSNLASIIRLHLMTYINILRFLEAPEKALLNYTPPVNEQQLSLFPK